MQVNRVDVINTVTYMNKKETKTNSSRYSFIPRLYAVVLIRNAVADKILTAESPLVHGASRVFDTKEFRWIYGCFNVSVAIDRLYATIQRETITVVKDV